MAPLDVTARYFTDDGRPLVDAQQAAAICDVKARTIYQWVRRGRLGVRGLGEDGEQLFDAGEVGALCRLVAA